jgi:hypothetical protein
MGKQAFTCTGDSRVGIGKVARLQLGKSQGCSWGSRKAKAGKVARLQLGKPQGYSWSLHPRGTTKQLNNWTREDSLLLVWCPTL